MTVIDLAGNQNSTATRTIVLDITNPTAFNLSYPDNNTVSHNATPALNWDDTIDVNFDNYTIQVDADVNFGSVDYSYSTTGSVTNSSFEVTSSWEVGIKYYWRVIAYDKASNNYITDSFVYTIPLTITIVNPINSSTLSDTTTWTYINITTEVNSDCVYNLTNSSFEFHEGTLFDITGTTEHSFNFSNYTGLVGGENYTLFYLCNSSRGVVSPNSTTHVFSVGEDTSPPVITNISITANLSSGETTVIRVNVTDDFLKDVWLELNDTNGNLANYTMNQETGTDFYNVSYEAGKIGIYYYRIFANDNLGNENNSGFLNYTVSLPNATTQDNAAPSTALPSSVVLISDVFNNTDLLKGVSVYLNSDSEFIYHQSYPQNQSLGDISADSLTTSRWFVAVPNTEATYTLNITYRDNHSNSWTSSSFQIQVIAGGGGVVDATFVDINSNTEVEVSSLYMAQILVKNITGDYENATNVEIKWVDSTGADNTGWLPYTSNVSTGIYNFTRTTPNSPTGQWLTEVRVTKNGNYYYDQQYWNLVGGLFDVETPVITDNTVDDIQATVLVNNTGNIDQDLTLEWTLTRTDTNDILVAASTTFLVVAEQVVTRTIDMSTSYIGEVKLTVLGTYSGTLQAGSYIVFNTAKEGAAPAPGGGGGGGRRCAEGYEMVDGSCQLITEAAEVEEGIPEELINISFKLDDSLIQSVDELLGIVTFESFGFVPMFVNLTFVIVDEEGNEVYRVLSNITVTTEEVLRWNYDDLGFLPDGKYTAIFTSLYNVYTQGGHENLQAGVFEEFRQEFEIGEEKGFFSVITGNVVGWMKNTWEWIVWALVLLLGLFWFVLWRRRKKKEKRGVKKKRTRRGLK